jgi:hypothetical protein
MTAVKERAVTLIQSMSDEKVSYVLDIINGIQGLSSETSEQDDIARRRQALANLQKFRGRLPADLNYKKELADARNERFGV